MWVLAALLLSCNRGNRFPDAAAPPLPSQEEICAYYNLYLRGDYGAYVDAMQSCDGKTEAYRKQMAILFKQHARLSAEKNGKVLSIRVNRIEPHDSGRMVNVFLVSQYESGTTEEKLLPMVFVDGRWRLQ